MITPRLTRLGNGVTVASLDMPGLETAAVALNADVGARHETEAENGLAHLFEHMVFKGTGRRTARQIAEQIEDVGGALNAWTSRDHTCFHARVLADDLPLGVDIITDLLLDPRFAREDLEKEREVVLSEIGEALDTPDDLVFDHLQAAAYPGQALGRSILGTPASLEGLTESSLAHWRDSHYRGASLVLTAAGKVDHDTLVAQADALLGHLPTAREARHEPARWVGGLLADGRRGEQTHIVLGFEGPHPLAPDYHAAQIFAFALGGGMSSRLFQELREERGLAYSVSASHSPHADTGILSLYCAARPRDAAAALDLARTVALQTAATLSPAEFARARAQLKAGLLMGLEGCAGQADWLGRALLVHGRIVSPAEAIATLEAVTLEQARAAGAAMLATPPALAAVGPRAEKLAA
jgi:predicted Zn-dependent peptidase